MDRSTLEALRDELEALWVGAFNVKRPALVSFAESVGRRLSNRGKEPTYVSILPGRNPLSIPGHKLKGFTVKSILRTLDADLDCWERQIELREKGQKGQ
jgi:hypothetical protein